MSFTFRFGNTLQCGKNTNNSPLYLKRLLSQHTEQLNQNKALLPITETHCKPPYYFHLSPPFLNFI